jgi:hypothetical protein
VSRRSPRDFRAELSVERCWDRATQAAFEAHREPLVDGILQNREELIGLCEFIEAHAVRSYLELGVWTGRLVSALDRLFRFDLVAACDDGYAARFGLPLALPARTRFFGGDCATEEYRTFRRDLGPVDLVFIDADHAYRAVRRDFAINRAFPHRFLAVHDITGGTPQTRGVRRFWEELTEGHKLEIVRPHRELGLPASTMGIGIWWETG